MDYSHGPIWKDEFDASISRWLTGISWMDDDRTPQVLNDGDFSVVDDKSQHLMA